MRVMRDRLNRMPRRQSDELFASEQKMDRGSQGERQTLLSNSAKRYFQLALRTCICEMHLQAQY